MNFNGFSRKLFDFWVQLKDNNSLATAGQNAAGYKEYIMAPLEALYLDLIPVMNEISDDFVLSPRRCISSPYTDRRFSPQTPIKEYMYLRFLTAKSDAVPGFYFDMGTRYYSYGIRIYKSAAASMEKIKANIAKNSVACDKILADVEKGGYRIIGKPYKRDHFPTVEEPAVKRLLNHGEFYIGKEVAVSQAIFSRALYDELAEGYLRLAPMFHLLDI